MPELFMATAESPKHESVSFDAGLELRLPFAFEANCVNGGGNFHATIASLSKWRFLRRVTLGGEINSEGAALPQDIGERGHDAGDEPGKGPISCLPAVPEDLRFLSVSPGAH